MALGDRGRVSRRRREPIEGLAQVKLADNLVIIIPVVEAHRQSDRRRIVDRVFDLGSHIERYPGRGAAGGYRHCAWRGRECRLRKRVVRVDPASLAVEILDPTPPPSDAPPRPPL